ncbi:helicase-associated domain-containing protein [Microbacterium sp. A93]|uniref:helicase-associated domain-containing protein n=1 Tax=Microbacterium sp. A93 TaxID=3450716 RepID=UPI003F43E3B4
MRAATLTDHLAGWPDDRLERLLALRPDLCHPPVPDFAALAARASTQMSVLRALDGLDRAHLDLLEALATLSETDPPSRPDDAGPTGTPARLAAFFQDADPGVVEGLLEDLAGAALVVGHRGDWRLPVPVSAALGSHSVSPGLTLDAVAPPPTGRTVSAALSRNAALAAIGDLLRGADDLLEALTPGLGTLRSGGVGVRELKRLTDATGSTPEDTAWQLELLAAARLTVLDPDTSTWRPATTVARSWRRSDRHAQWEVLVAGWLGSGRAPLLGTPPAEPTGRALAADRNRPDAPRLRVSVLEAALEIHHERPGTVLDPAVAERQRWRSPRPFARTGAFTPALLTEAERLGLTGAGALTEAGALVAAGHLDQAAAAVGTALPAPLTTVRLQGDLTAVAPGYLDPEVARQLAGLAEVEGDGAARIYRFTDASLHGALDGGTTASEIETFLTDHSEDPIPQSLQYLIRDVARRHGLLTVGSAGAWLQSEDTDLLDVITADPAMAPARLERLAPTVVTAGVGPAALHRTLTAAGHRAALLRPAGGEDGPAEEIQRARRQLSEASAFPEPVRSVRWGPSEEELAAQIARLRSAPRPAPSGPGPEEAVAVLRQATRQRTEVDLVTVDQRGRRQSRRVVPLAVAGGRVRCLVPAQDAETVVPLHRVVSAAPVTAAGAG